ncbi:hypothetical protein CRV24_005274 [Beauveria bassiana]|nr:hypothetical protein CRV24_005274 [Beauveria bassiana]
MPGPQVFRFCVAAPLACLYTTRSTPDYFVRSYLLISCLGRIRPDTFEECAFIVSCFLEKQNRESYTYGNASASVVEARTIGDRSITMNR